MLAEKHPGADHGNCLVQESVQLRGDGAPGEDKLRLGVALLEPLSDVQEGSALRAEADHVKVCKVPPLQEEGGVAGDGELVGREVEENDEELPWRILLRPPFHLFDHHPEMVDHIAARLLHVDCHQEHMLAFCFNE